MTKEERKMLEDVKRLAGEARVLMSKAEEKLGEAAGACKGTPMENIIFSIYDELIDLKLDLGKQTEIFEQRLNGTGNEMPDSWKEAG